VYRRAISSLMSVALGIVCAAANAIAGHPEEKPAQRAARPGMTSFVWTNDEIDMLRENNVTVSIFGLTPRSVVAAKPGELESYDRTKDPAWYAQQAAILRAEIDVREAELTRQQEALVDAQNQRQTDPGIAMDRGNVGITAEAGIENLHARVQEVQAQLEALADLAQHNGIPPGVLRG
jgi:hypothetical protein